MTMQVTPIDQRHDRLGRVVRPGDADWDEARSTFNLLDDQQPAAIAFPADAHEVAALVVYARANGLRVTAQATGHNAGPLAALDDTLIVNTSRLTGVEIDAAARRVRAGAGTKWEKVSPLLVEHGLAALHGSSPDVGIVGYSLGGGIGWLSRKFGLQANAVTAIELVDANGRVLNVTASQDPELFWALRGGGGSFGVVTAIEFAVVPLETVYAGAMFFPVDRITEVLNTWSRTLPTFPEELTTWASVIHFPPLEFLPPELRGNSFMVVLGAYLGDEESGRRLLSPIRTLGPVMDTYGVSSPAVLGDLAMDPPVPLPFRSTTAMLGSLGPDAIETVARVAGEGSALNLVEFRHLGGALSRAPEGAGARSTLPGNIGFFSLGVAFDPEGETVVRGQLAEIAAAVSPYRAGDYPNFVMDPADPAAFFDEETWGRLRRVKALYDPYDVFRGNHHVPPAQRPER